MLSFAERLILFNQYELLKKLDPDKSSLYERHQEVVEKGYEDLYKELGIAETTVDATTSREVDDIVRMFGAIKSSTDRSQNGPRFVGFRGNQANGPFAYADFLSRILNFPQEFAKGEGASPEGQLEKYRTMLQRWEAIGRKRDLTAEDVGRLVA